MNIIVLAVVVSVVFLAIIAAIAKSRLGAGGAALFCVAAATGLFYYRTQDSLQIPIPVEFVADRLAFEANSISQEAALPLNSNVGQVGNRRSATLRHQMLQRLHDERSRDFVAADGFGSRRITISLEEWNKIMEQASPSPKPEPSPLPMSEVEIRESLQRLHDEQTNDFVTADGFGLSRWVDPVVRKYLIDDEQEPPYTPDATLDQFHVPLAVERQDRLDLEYASKGIFSGQYELFDPERMGLVQDRDHVDLPETKTAFQLVRLELVSLLKHETPVAYVSLHLPQMDELRDAPTRPLDDFERRAIERLRSYEDLVIDDAPNRIRMVGSLRAGKDCMECHSVRRGELLGAFSYELLGPSRVPMEPGA